MNTIGPAWLFCPADRADRYSKAAERSDRVILDLEDAVAPDRKAAAREAMLASELDPERVIVRINGLDTEHAADDLATVRATHYRTLMVPKAERPESLDELAEFDVVALCETAAGVLAAADLARHPRVTALMWGAEDLVADMGGRASRDADGRYLGFALHTRSQILLAAAAAGVVAVDAVYLDIADTEGLRAELREAVDSGFDVKACIHPSQVPVVREAFRPSARQIAWARAVLAADTGGVVSVDGVMVDGPVVMQARHILGRVDTEAMA